MLKVLRNGVQNNWFDSFKLTTDKMKLDSLFLFASSNDASQEFKTLQRMEFLHKNSRDTTVADTSLHSSMQNIKIFPKFS